MTEYQFHGRLRQGGDHASQLGADDELQTEQLRALVDRLESERKADP